MKYIRLFEEFNDLDTELTQSLEIKNKMLRDYKSLAAQLKNIYIDDKNGDPDMMAKKILDRANISNSNSKTPNTYLLKYVQILKDERKARDLEKSITENENKSNDLKNQTDKTLVAQNSTQITQIQNDIRKLQVELTTLKNKVSKDYKQFDIYMKAEIEETKKQLLNVNGKQ